MTNIRGRAAILVISVGAVVLLLIGILVGVAVAPKTSSSTDSGGAPGPVDIGFSQDMIVHHTQGVAIAEIASDNTDDADIKTLAYDISSHQQTDIGEMSGWLDLWGESRIDRGVLMSWMGSDMGGMDMNHPAASTTVDTSAPDAADGAVMPGMATNTEIDKLKTLKGRDSDIYFLQLMLRHHQGGLPMMQYAADHASSPVVRNFAGHMYQSQEQEISRMTQQLATWGATPLPTS